jgi:hypothetical protein
MTVDRRLDYDLLFIGPVIGSTFNLYKRDDTKPNVDKDRAWKGARIRGTVYGGVEMAYDGDYNIISANTQLNDDGELQSVTPNKLLEYSYQLSAIDEDAKTIYNKGNVNSIWERDRLSRICSMHISYMFDADGEYTIFNLVNNETVFSRMSVNGNEWIAVPANGKYTFEKDKTYDIRFELKEGKTEIPQGTLTNTDGTPLAGITFSDGEIDVDVLDDVTTEYYYKDGSSLNKRFYEASLGGVDIRDYLWSNFNKNRLTKYITDTVEQGGQGGSGYDALIGTAKPYIFKYPSTTANLYNGDFNREDAIKANNYPTRRYIDVCNIVSAARYNFLVSSCSYGSMQTVMNDDHTITAEAKETDSIEMNFNFENPVQFVEPSDDNKNFGNIVYTSYKVEGDFRRFTTDQANIMFKISKKSDSDFDIYTGMPSLIRVLPFTNNVDGITYFKTATDNGEINARKSINDAISNVSVYDWWGHLSNYLFFGSLKDVVAPDNIDVDDDLIDNYGRHIPGRFFINSDDDYITSSSNEFSNITFVKTISGDDFKNVKVFSILVRRFYVSNEDNKLINSIKTIELSELIDCRDVLLRFAPTYVDGEGNTVKASYVELRNLKAEVTMEGDEQSQGGDDDDEGDEPTSGEGDAKNYVQTVAFMMHINTDGEPSTLENQVFIDYDNMSFTFMFKRGDDEYYVDCGSITMIENTEGEGEEAVTKSIDLVFSMKCPQEMGTLCDDDGNSRKWICNMIAKTSSGFSYRIDFKLDSGNQEFPETPGVNGRITTNGRING